MNVRMLLKIVGYKFYVLDSPAMLSIFIILMNGIKNGNELHDSRASNMTAVTVM